MTLISIPEQSLRYRWEAVMLLRFQMGKKVTPLHKYHVFLQLWCRPGFPQRSHAFWCTRTQRWMNAHSKINNFIHCVSNTANFNREVNHSGELKDQYFYQHCKMMVHQSKEMFVRCQASRLNRLNYAPSLRHQNATRGAEWHSGRQSFNLMF